MQDEAFDLWHAEPKRRNMEAVRAACDAVLEAIKNEYPGSGNIEAIRAKLEAMP